MGKPYELGRKVSNYFVPEYTPPVYSNLTHFDFSKFLNFDEKKFLRGFFLELEQVWADWSHLAVDGSGRTGHRGRTQLSLTAKNFKAVKQFQRTNFPNFIKVKCFRGGSK